MKNMYNLIIYSLVYYIIHLFQDSEVTKLDTDLTYIIIEGSIDKSSKK